MSAIASKSLPPDGQLIAQARPLVKDLFRPSPAIYWADLLACVGVAYPSFYFAHQAYLHPIARIALLLLAGLSLYRAALFIHELAHLGGSEFRGFRFFWNATIGMPFLVPSFLYYTHLEHHRPKHYGTHQDGEYLPLARGPVFAMFKFLAGNLFIPALMVIRFLLLTPVSWISKSLRALIHRYASAMVIDPSYARPVPAPKEWRIWRIQEVLCLLYLITIGVLVATRVIHWTWVLQAYVLAVFVLTINGVRTLAAHRYRHMPDDKISLVEQLLDSINHPRQPILTEIWAPVGLRFHALHHLFPGLPYHALPTAHKRLMEGLPEDSVYRQVNSPSLLASLRQLWRDARESSRNAAPAATITALPPGPASAS